MDTDVLDQLTESVSLFDLKKYVNNDGAYNYFDWLNIENKANQWATKMLKYISLKRKYTVYLSVYKELEDGLCKFREVPRIIINKYYTRSTQAIDH